MNLYISSKSMSLLYGLQLVFKLIEQPSLKMRFYCVINVIKRNKISCNKFDWNRCENMSPPKVLYPELRYGVI
jgi:hypothetical protein